MPKIMHGPSRGASTGLLTLVVFVVGFLLIGLNYWHAMRCVPSESTVSSDAMDIHIASLERRLLASEAENIKVQLVLKKVLHVIQNKYVELAAAEFESLNKQAKEESVKIALGIAAQPPPAMPEFVLDPSLADPQALSSFVDDFFAQQKGSGSEFDLYEGLGEGFNGGGKFNEFNKLTDDFLIKPMKSEEEAKADMLTEEEKDAECNKLKNDYNVIIGVSWGNLPYDLQDKWAAYRCDMYFSGVMSA